MSDTDIKEILSEREVSSWLGVSEPIVPKRPSEFIQGDSDFILDCTSSVCAHLPVMCRRTA
jgi:hypothetical protein